MATNNKVIALQNVERHWATVLAASEGKATIRRSTMNPTDASFMDFAFPKYRYNPELEKPCWEELRRVHPDWENYRFKDFALKQILIDREKLAQSMSYADLVSAQKAEAQELSRLLVSAFQIAAEELGLDQSTDIRGRLPEQPSYWWFGLPYVAMASMKEGKKAAGILMLTAYPSLFSEEDWDIVINLQGVKTLESMERTERLAKPIRGRIARELGIECVQLPYS